MSEVLDKALDVYYAMSAKDKKYVRDHLLRHKIDCPHNGKCNFNCNCCPKDKSK